MLVWATEFPSAAITTSPLFLSLSKQWLKGSPHYPWESYDFGEPPVGQRTVYQHSGQEVEVIRVLDGEKEWCGFQHRWLEDGKRQWVTALIGRETGIGYEVSVKLYCNVISKGESAPIPRKPQIIVKVLFEMVGGGRDGLLDVCDVPHVLDLADVDLAAGLLSGGADCLLPIVYVSRPLQAEQVRASGDRLARALGGLAHVVVEPSRQFGDALSRKMFGANPVGGVCAIVWPQGAGRSVFLSPRQFANPHSFEREIGERVRQAHILGRPSIALTWAYGNELLARNEIAALKKAKSSEVQAYVDAFDAESDALKQLLEQSEREVARLRRALAEAEAAGANGAVVLRGGVESEPYDGERRDAVIRSLEFARAGVAQDSRRAHLLEDVLKHNAASDYQDQFEAELRAAIGDKGDLTPAGKKRLEALGFVVTEDGKHHKLVFEEDDRYVFSLSKSGSDWRGGRNAVSEIAKALFK